MEFSKIALILSICVISTSILGTHEVSHNETDKQAPTKRHQDELRSDKKEKEYERLSDDNEEDSGNADSYDMTTCKSLIEHNVKGSFNLSAHNLICKL